MPNSREILLLLNGNDNPDLTELDPNLTSLKVVGLNGIPRNFRALTCALESFSSLDTLKLEMVDLGEETWHSLFRVLGGLPQLKNLSLSTNDEGDHEDDYEYDDMDHPDHRPSHWLSGISNLFQNQQSKLINLELRGYRFDTLDSLIGPVSQCLEDNKTLKSLSIYFTDEKGGSWAPLGKVLQLYNHSLKSVTNTYLSNKFDNKLPYYITHLLEMNGREDDKDRELVVLRKSLDFDFLIPDRVFSVKPFEEDFEIELLPYLLWSIGTNRKKYGSWRYRGSALFRFVQNMPMLVTKNVVTFEQGS